MRIPRIHVPNRLAGASTASVSGTGLDHIRRVLRLRPGAALILFDGRGGEYAGTIQAYSSSEAIIALGKHNSREAESPLRITLWQGICRGNRMDFVVEKATELGVAAIVPLITQRVVVRLDERRAAKRRDHWQAVARSACEQCGRNRVPDVLPPVALADALALGADQSILLLDPQGSSRAADLAGQRSNLTLVIGPEGGLTPEERESARLQGAQGLSLGPRILRTDTAALAALAVLQSRLGDA